MLIVANSNTTNATAWSKLYNYEKTGRYVVLVGLGAKDGTRWLGEAKVIISLITWGFYLVMVFLRANAGWRGRKAAFMALSVLGFSALTWAAHVGLKPLIEK